MKYTVTAALDISVGKGLGQSTYRYGIEPRLVSFYLLMFNVHPTGTVISRRYTNV